ncbi:hypothetical protein [Pseudothermotoga sp.]|uniref:hypothetical protein n=1 Tax=Pseudothermotoga sp. TaxID=2033661 RepID=UPI0031F6979B
MDLEKYIRAIERSLMQMVAREISSVDVSEIWLDTSIPVDLIIEIFKSGQIRVPQELQSIVDGKKVIWTKET